MSGPSEWPAHFDDFVSRLRKSPRRSTKGFYGICCPGHDDKSASAQARFDPETGKMILHCFNGCSFSEMVAGLGMKESDFFMPDRDEIKYRERKMIFVCSYDYRDENSQLLYQSVRWVDRETNKKTFSYRRPNPLFDTNRSESKESNPRWIGDIEGVRRVPYALPELLDDLEQKPDRWVVIAEGEKCVDFVRSQKIAATTNPMGAGKWLPEYNAHLAGRNVVVIPDEDEPDKKTGRLPGLEHANEVCLSIYGIARTIKLVRLEQVKSGSGLDDWMQAKPENNLSALRAIIEATPNYKPGVEQIPDELLLLAAEIARQVKKGGIDSLAQWFGLVGAAKHLLDARVAPNLIGECAVEYHAETLRLAAILLRGLNVL